MRFPKKDFFFIILIFILSFPAIKTLLIPGFFETHDGHFHLIRLAHFYQTLKEGHFPVRWAEDLNSRYGSPLFNFNYPLIYYLGSLIHALGFGFGDTLKIIICLSFLLSGIFIFFWIKELFNRTAGLLAAIFYIYAPYRFVSSYVSGRFGEITAYIFIPLTFFIVTKFAKKPNKFNLALASLSYALLIISYNVSALIFSPLILSYLLFLLCLERKQKKLLLRIILFLVLALSLSAFFWLPALFERKYVWLGHKAIYDYSNSFPDWHHYLYSPWGYGFEATGTQEGVSYQIGLGQLLVLSLTSLMLLYRWLEKKIKKSELLALFFLAWFFLVFFIMNKISIPIWETVPLLQTIQFPFRFLSMIILFTSFFAGWLIYQLKNKKILLFTVYPAPTLLVYGVYCLLITLVLYANRNHLRPGFPERHPDEFYFDSSRNYLIYGTTDVAGENTPIWNKEKLFTFGEKIINESEEGEITNLEIQPRFYTFETDSEKEVRIRVNTLYYPGWQAILDKNPLMIDYKNKEGVIKLKIPKGKHQVKIFFKDTPLRKMANLLSLTGFLFTLCLISKPISKKLKLVQRSRAR